MLPDTGGRRCRCAANIQHQFSMVGSGDPGRTTSHALTMDLGNGHTKTIFDVDLQRKGAALPLVHYEENTIASSSFVGRKPG